MLGTTRFLLLTAVIATASFALAQRTTPRLESISPSTVSSGSGSFVLAVHGANFSSYDKITWNGLVLATTVKSATEAQALIPAWWVAQAGSAKLAIFDWETRRRSNSATLYIAPAPAAPSVSIGVSPSSASLPSGSTQQFAAAVLGTEKTGVTWSASGGTISSTGLFTAPTSGGIYTVRATSTADFTKSAEATVNVTQAGSPAPPAGRVLSLELNESSGTLAADSSGNGNHATLANGAAFDSGHTGNGAQLTQTAKPADVITVPASSSLNSIARDITVAMWVNRRGDGYEPAGYNTLMSRQVGTGYTEPFALFYATGQCCSPGMYFFVNTQNAGNSALAAGVPVPLNEWHHWVGTYDGSQVKLYRDGVLVSTVNHSGDLVKESKNPLSIGAGFNDATGVPNEPFLGKVDDVQLYARALSAAEVQVLYSSSLPPADTISSGSEQPTLVAPISVSISPTSASLNAGATQQFIAPVSRSSNTGVTWSATGGTISSTGLYTAPTGGGPYKIRATSVADPTKSAEAAVSVSQLASPPAELVLSLELNESSGTLSADSSGNGNNAKLANGATFVPGHKGNAALFAQTANTANVITVPASSTINNITRDVTVASWVNRHGDGYDPGGWNIILSRQIGTGYTEPFFLAYNTRTTSMYFGVNTSTGGYSPTTPNMAVPLNEWHHWVGTYDGNQVKLYRDGVLQWTVNHAGGNLAAELNTPLAIGAGFNDATGVPNEPFLGRVDDVQLYDRALSASEVQALYSSSLPAADTTTNSGSEQSTVVAPISVSISPASTTLNAAATRQFTASVNGSSNTAVTWSATGGTVSTTGMYTAPTTAGTYTITAKSLADPTKSASVNVTVASVSVSVTPNNTSVRTGDTVQFATTVTGSSNSAVTWAIESGGGSISSSGLYTAPSTAGTATIVATSVADPLASSVANVTINVPVSLLISVSPNSLSFGSVITGSSATKPVALTNTGNSTVSVSAASIIGSDFSVSGLSFPFTLAPGASRSANVSFAPSVSGTAAGSVSFVSDATNSPATATLSGSGSVPQQRTVTLRWQSSTSGGGHNVYRSQTSGGPYSRLNSAIVYSEDFIDTPVNSGQTYFYVVTTVDSSGAESSYSSQVTAVIPTL